MSDDKKQKLEEKLMEAASKMIGGTRDDLFRLIDLFRCDPDFECDVLFEVFTADQFAILMLIRRFLLKEIYLDFGPDSALSEEKRKIANLELGKIILQLGNYIIEGILNDNVNAIKHYYQAEFLFQALIEQMNAE